MSNDESAKDILEERLRQSRLDVRRRFSVFKSSIPEADVKAVLEFFCVAREQPTFYVYYFDVRSVRGDVLSYDAKISGLPLQVLEKIPKLAETFFGEGHNYVSMSDPDSFLREQIKHAHATPEEGGLALFEGRFSKQRFLLRYGGAILPLNHPLVYASR